MRWTCALLLCAAAAGCHLSLHSPGGGGGGGDDMAVGDDLAGADLSGCQCPFGCSASNACLHLQPSGPLNAGDYNQAGLDSVTIGSGVATFNTDTGQISGALTRPAGAGLVGGIAYRNAAQAGGPNVGVFSVAGLSLAKGASIVVKGTAAFALVSSKAVTVDGLIDASCSMMMTGPGGSPAGMGMGAGAAGAGDATTASGGGGGGYGDVGGTGGPLGTVSGGPIWGDVTQPTFTLVGGSGGGQGGNAGGAGGGGGGAVEIAVDDALGISGTIHVGGCGGLNGGGKKAGGGGGAGGTIVLEAGHVTLASSAVLAANGGGGGGGDGGKPGADATPDVNPAPGGMPMGMGGAGGVGGARTTMPGLHHTQGGAGGDTGKPFGGGGGGGCGRIGVFAAQPAPAGITDDSQAVSPDLLDSNASNQKLTVYGVASFQ